MVINLITLLPTSHSIPNVLKSTHTAPKPKEPWVSNQIPSHSYSAWFDEAHLIQTNEGFVSLYICCFWLRASGFCRSDSQPLLYRQEGIMGLILSICFYFNTQNKASQIYFQFINYLYFQITQIKSQFTFNS